MGNVGLHNMHYSNPTNTQVTKVLTYKSSKHYIQKAEMPVVTSKLTDVKWDLIKKYVSHYLLKDVPFDFLVTNTHYWDPHPLKATSITGNPERYTTLADSVRGPQICTHRNTVAVQFYVTKDQIETVTVMNNFVSHYVDKIYNREKIDLKVDETHQKANLNSNLIQNHH